MKARAIRIHKYGPPSVLKWDEIDVPNPKADQVLIRHTAIGFISPTLISGTGFIRWPAFPPSSASKAPG